MLKKIMFLLAMVLSFACLASSLEPESWPTCDSPQNIGPMQAMGGSSVYRRSSICWNGKEFAAIWADYSDGKLWFRRFYADGTPASSAVNPGGLNADYWYPLRIAWSGSGYGVAYSRYSGITQQTYFVKLDANGNPAISEVKVSNWGATETAQSYYCDMASNGNGFCVVWVDRRNSAFQIYGTLLDGAGGIVAHDFTIATTSGGKNNPRVAWYPGAGRYQIVWEDNNSGTTTEIRGRQMDLTAGLTSEAILASTGTSSYLPALAASGGGMGLVWYDNHEGNYEIYFTRISLTGSKLGGDIRVSSAAGDSLSPALSWTGAEWGAFWADNRSGGMDVWFQRVSAAGEVLGSNLQVTISSSQDYPEAAFAKHGYLVTSTGDGAPNWVTPWGCFYAGSLPSCPGNLLAYNITGNAATVSWSQSGSNTSDIAYYIVYRNNAEIARTSNTYYADSGLGLNTTYNYMIQPVDAGQAQNYTCTSSLYVKTNATLTLMLDKNAPNAHLYWNDAGMNNYNVFRGTSPQVMSLIGSTSGQSADDQNVLLDNVNYFYTVDEPGQ